MVDKIYRFMDGVLGRRAEKFLSSRKYKRGIGCKKGDQGYLLEFENGESLCTILFWK